MTVLWMDDPSYYSNAQLSSRYDNVTAITVNAATGRFGTASWRTNNNNNFGALVKLLPSSSATLTAGFSFKLITLTTQGNDMVTFLDSGTAQTSVWVTATGQIQLLRGGTTVFGTLSTNALQIGVWYRMEFKLTVDPSAGVAEVRINGTSVGWFPSTGSLNTRGSANSSANQVRMGNIVNNTPNIFDANDFVVTDNNSPNAGFLGDKKCYLRMPNSDSSVQWTRLSGASNYLMVNENPADDDTTYNSSSTPTQLDLLGLPALPGAATNIVAINNVIKSRKDDAGTRTIHDVMKSNTTQSESADIPLSTTYQYNDFILDQDPDTSAAWTPTGANALLVGYKEIA